MKLFYTCIFCFYFSAALAQNKPEVLKCYGPAPVDFTGGLREKQKVQSKKYGSEIDKEYLLESNFFLNQILSSGKVVYGDSVSEYVNRIAGRLLRSEPELKQELRIYVLRSTVPNAMSLHQGVVFVTTGLIAQMNSEAELAFVLAHEIAHYKKRHVLNSYKKIRELKGQATSGKLSLELLISELYTYSRENEYEADFEGFGILKNSPYSTSAAEHALGNLLEKDHHPDYVWTARHAIFPDTSQIYSVFKRKKLRNLFDTLEPAEFDGTSETDESDTVYSTHPALNKRMMRLKEKAGDSAGGLEFVENGDRWNQIKNMALLDVAFLSFLEQNYIKAIFLADYVQQKTGEFEYAGRISLYARYRFSLKYNKGIRTADYFPYLTESKNQWRIFRYLCNTMHHPDFGHLRNEYYQYAQQFNDSGLFQIARYYHVHRQKTDSTANTTPIKDAAIRDITERIPYQVKKRPRYLSVRNPEFKGANDVLFFIPGITEMNLLKKKQRSYLDEETSQARMYNAFNLSARKLQMNAILLDNRISKDFSTETYNRYCRVNEWLEERQDDTSGNLAMLCVQNIKSDPVLSKVKYINASEYVYLIHRRQFRSPLIYLLVLTYPTIPIALVWSALPQKDLFVYNLTLNVNNGRAEAVTIENFNHKFSPDLINSYAYKSMYRLQKGKLK